MSEASHIDICVIGAGPAGLAAAEVASASGCSVMLVDARPSFGRKFLMAGKSGLNLTMDLDPNRFLEGYREDADWVRPMLDVFGPVEIQSWAHGLGQEIFTGSSGRVFPVAMKASPLLRSWIARLNDQEVIGRTSWRWQGWEGESLLFDTPEGEKRVMPRATVLALGGASWARLGSDGAWVRHIPDTAPFKPSNCGFECTWSSHMARHFGAPVKSVLLTHKDRTVQGEFVISRHGVEGSGIYALSHSLREDHEPTLLLDLLPDIALERLTERLARPRGKMSIANYLRKTARLDPVKRALVFEAGDVPVSHEALAQHLKALPLKLTGPRPMDEAISTAGGVRRNALDSALMLKDMPGVFCAGEMLDWDAPTGGYLITACLATGRWAGQAAVNHITQER